jgi:hypothetical protein
MKTSKASDMRSEYDFSKAERGKFHRPLHKGYKVHVRQKDGTVVTNHYTLAEGTVLLEPDVRAYFPDSASVNTALRSLIQLMSDMPSKDKTYRQTPAIRRVAEKK